MTDAPRPSAPPPAVSHRLPTVEFAAADHCDVDDGCITCGDVAVPLTAAEAGAVDARCRDDHGREEVVALELVGPVAPGDRLLVHARVAIARLEDARLREEEPR